MKLSVATLVVVLASMASDSADAFVTPRPLVDVPLKSQAFAPPPSRHAVQHISSTSTQLKSSLVDTQQLTTFFLETVISSGVPALFTVLVIAFVANAFRPKKNTDDDFGNNLVAELYNDLYGDSRFSKPSSPFKFFPRGPPTLLQNTGIPAQQYIKISNRNSKLDSYQFSMDAATKSKALAASKARSRNFDRALQLGMGSGLTKMSASQKGDLLRAEKEFLKRGSQLQGEIAKLQAQLTKSAIDDEMRAIGMDSKDMDPDANIVKDEKKKAKFQLPPIMPTKNSKLLKEVTVLQENLMRSELNFVQDLVSILGPERASGIKAALLGDVAARGAGGLLSQLQDRPLTVLLNEIEGDDERRKSLFVTQFPGDPTASQVADLREEVTAIVRNAKPGDEALVVLQTGGGTVTGYGLAAAQLQRFKQNGMKLTICVEQVAASGGYMMSCVADKIIASPFAVLGSIGVISDIPNVYNRLKEEGIEFQTITAGKYKRTITPTKKVAPEDIRKSKEDIEEVLKLFKNFVKENRPSLDIDKVATGETWFGTDALERNLCDEIKTVDDVVTEYIDAGYNVYDVKYEPLPEKPDFANLISVGADNRGGMLSRAVGWLARSIAAEFKSELGDLTAYQRPDRKYMMSDDTADRIRSE